MYLKYDKKLILEVDDLLINYISSNKKLTTQELKDNFLEIPKLLKYFRKIDIERLKIKDNEFTILINEKEFYIDNKDINLSASLDFVNGKMKMNIYSMYFKNLNLTFFGEALVESSKNKVLFSGYFNKDDNINGEINLKSDDRYLDFFVNTTNSIKSISFLKDFFRLDSIAESWMYDNVKGDINLKYLSGKIDLEKKKPISSSIKGKAYIENAHIKFNKKVKTVNTSRLEINYENDTLSFNLNKPKYGNSKLYGSRVYINNLTSLEKGKVFVDLKSDSILNDDILEILNAYEIKLPLKQIDGDNTSSLLLEIPYLASKKMQIIGDFSLKNAHIELNDFKVFVNHANISLKNNMVSINNSLIKYEDLAEGKLFLNIDTKKMSAKGKVDFIDFKLITNEKDVLNLSNKEIPLSIDFNNDTIINLENLNSKIIVDENNLTLDISNLEDYYDYSELLKESGLNKGDLKVSINKDNKIFFSMNLKELDFPFEKNTEKITTLSAKGTILNDIITIKTDDSDIEIILEKEKNPLIRLSNIDLSLEKEEDNTLNKEFPSIDLELNNSFIKFDEKHKYKTQWAKINLNKEIISFEGKALEVDLPLARGFEKLSELTLKGTFKDKILEIKSEDNKLDFKYDITKEKMFMNVQEYNVLYNTDDAFSEGERTSYYIDGKDSNIVINGKYVAKAETYKFIFEEHKTDVKLKYKETEFKYHEDFDDNLSLEAINMSDDFLNSLISKDIISGGSVNLNAYGKNGFIEGTAFIKESKIKDLAILNNLLMFINTSPALINPLFAVPSVVGMATEGGFNINGYRVTDGRIDFTYNFDNKLLNMYKIFTKGNGIDFEGFANINFDSSRIDSELKLIFFKSYSKVVGAIPVLNYLFLGDEKRVDTEVEIYGTLDDPKYKTNVARDGVNAPVNFLKRLINSPMKIIDSLSE